MRTRAIRGRRSILLVLLLVPAAAGPVLADGGFLPPHHLDVYEPTQKALIVYDDAAQREDLVIQASFEGDAEEFGWIIPVPAPPEIGTAENALFFECSDYTRPLVRTGGGCSGDGGVARPAGDEGLGNGLVIHDEQTVGIYHALTIGAEDAGALVAALEEWGYLHAGNREADIGALKFYVDKFWCFVAMRVESGSLPHEEVGPWSGGTDPVRLTFDSPEMVYPLRISAISAAPYCEVLIYAVADRRVTFPGAWTEFAEPIGKQALIGLGVRCPHLRAYLPGPCFLTKLRCVYTPAQMSDDVVLVAAGSDAPYRQVVGAGFPVAEGLMLGLALVLVGWPLRRRAARGRGDPDSLDREA